MTTRGHPQCVFLLIILACGVTFAGAIGNFTIPTRLGADEFNCLEQCKFKADNQTLILIDVDVCRRPSGESCQAAMGIGYYTTPVRMKDPATKTVASFNTSFTFREEPEVYNGSDNNVNDTWRRGDGFTFMMSGSNGHTGEPTGRFGIFRLEPKPTDPKLIAIEFDSWVSRDTDPGMVQEGHVGLDVGSAKSNASSACFSYLGNQSNINISLWHRDIFQTWIEYDGVTKNLQFRISNTSSRPDAPLFDCTYDLYDAVDETMYIGFSGAVGDHWAVFYIYNWTFTSFGIDPAFPLVPGPVSVGVIAGAAVGGALVLLAALIGAFLYRRKLAQDALWNHDPALLEMAGVADFISYKHLSAATKQFSDQSKLGEGGFGSVYKGVLPKTGTAVAVKRVSNDSRQGEREFLAEVQIISQLRHRNIVELVGFCRDRGKFLLVYELMPRGSLDQALFKPETPEAVLSWSQRWKIVSGTAAALHYLHEGWRQQVIHRDVKSSNIMLDEQLNPKLGDFGLARLVDHEKNAPTTMVAGTFGYLAPEASGGKFTDKTDVFAFGAVCLEVACGRKSYCGHVENYDDLILGELVWRRMNEGNLVSVADPLLLGQFDADQMCTVLKLGMLCSTPDPVLRPSMRQVVQVLAGDADVPDVPVPLPKAAAGMPQYSIEDLMSGTSKSGTHSNSKLNTAASAASSSLVTSTSNSFGGVDTTLFPR